MSTWWQHGASRSRCRWAQMLERAGPHMVVQGLGARRRFWRRRPGTRGSSYDGRAATSIEDPHVPGRDGAAGQHALLQAAARDTQLRDVVVSAAALEAAARGEGGGAFGGGGGGGGAWGAWGGFVHGALSALVAAAAAGFLALQPAAAPGPLRGCASHANRLLAAAAAAGQQGGQGAGEPLYAGMGRGEGGGGGGGGGRAEGRLPMEMAQ
jgi:hypothetical protein